MIASLALFCLERRFAGKMEAAIIFLNEAQRRAAEKFHRQFRGMSALRFEPRIIVLQRLKVKELQEANDILLAPLYPLCDITPTEIKQQAEDWASEVNGARHLSKETRGNLLALLVTSISHRMRGLKTEEIGEMLGGIKMLDTPVGKEIYRKGALSGRKEGLRKGAYQGAQHILLKQAAEKFGRLPADLEKSVTAIASTQELDRLAVALLKVQSLAEFKAALRRM